jgi:hypothetical protein
VSWDSAVPTAYPWDVTVLPASIDFSGRTVTEQTVENSASDTCYFPGSAHAEYVGVDGSTATLNSQSQYTTALDF